MAEGSNRIETLIDDLEEFFDNCRPHTLSKDKVIVRRDELDALIHELRVSTPDIIRQYEKMVSQRDKILEDAKKQAEELINDATSHTSELVSEHEIMREAYEQADKIVRLAHAQAQEILDDAVAQANAVKMAAMQYMDDSLGNLENVLANAVNDVQTNYGILISNLTQYYEVVHSNRAELHQTDESGNGGGIAGDGADGDDLDLL